MLFSPITPQQILLYEIEKQILSFTWRYLYDKSFTLKYSLIEFCLDLLLWNSIYEMTSLWESWKLRNCDWCFIKTSSILWLLFSILNFTWKLKSIVDKSNWLLQTNLLHQIEWLSTQRLFNWDCYSNSDAVDGNPFCHYRARDKQKYFFKFFFGKSKENHWTFLLKFECHTNCVYAVKRTSVLYVSGGYEIFFGAFLFITEIICEQFLVWL